MAEIIKPIKAKIDLICQGYFSSYKVLWDNEVYYIRVSNDDLNEFEVEVYNNLMGIVEGDLKQDILSYLEEQEII